MSSQPMSLMANRSIAHTCQGMWRKWIPLPHSRINRKKLRQPTTIVDSAFPPVHHYMNSSVTPSHKTSLNPRLADKRCLLNSSWGSIWVIVTLLQKYILQTLNFDVVIIFCSINDIKVLTPLLRKMCKRF